MYILLIAWSSLIAFLQEMDKRMSAYNLFLSKSRLHKQLSDSSKASKDIVPDTKWKYVYCSVHWRDTFKHTIIGSKLLISLFTDHLQVNMKSNELQKHAFV